MSKMLNPKSIVFASLLVVGVSSQAAPLKIGVVPGAYADAVGVAAAEAKEQGLEVEVIEFSDWNTPNLALDAKDIDLNFFQHQPFLENVEAEKGFDFSVVGETACADSWGRALATDEPSLSLPCFAERRYGGVPDEEMLMALPPRLTV